MAAASMASDARPKALHWPIGPILWRLGRHPSQLGPEAERRKTVAARADQLLRRFAALRAEPGRPLVLTSPATYQTLGGPGAARSADPFLGPVVDALTGTPLDPAVIELGADLADDVAWARLTAPGNERHLPFGPLIRAMGVADDDRAAEIERTRIAGRLAEPLPSLDVDGVDVSPWIAEELRRHAATGLASELRSVRRLQRLLEALRPSSLLLINEYSNPEWLIAAHAAGVPVVAVQHGIIHRHHAGYVLPERKGLPLADRTFLFGAYEARLLTERSVYRPDEVAVSGAPRLDLVPERPAHADREAVRASMGAQPGDRLVVFSSTSSPSARDTTLAAALDTLLDQPWPGVHLVVKLHPAETDDGFYGRLLEGIAQGRGFEAPPITVVKAIDLYALLAAADAHLGVSSTVLTDAAAAGTRNLIATGLAGTDLLGYVDAGVAEPVRCAADLVAALNRPAPADLPARREAFLADHFAPGRSSARIADALTAIARGESLREPAVEVRRATMADAELLLRWANDPVTRAAGFRPEPIALSEHLAWLERRLASPGCRVYIGLRDGVPVGQTRLDRGESGATEVSIAVAPEARGRGVGRGLLAATMAAGRADAGLGVVTFSARVRPDNAASVALFRGAGFTEVGDGVEAGLPYRWFRRG
jgi:RimJ/RimL family protein N-acetyltransferase